jgi:oxalate decarboxylase/phosphoglucose isomerase-like protein (cupin superfamily)
LNLWSLIQFVFETSQLQRYQFPTHINDLVLDRSEAQNGKFAVKPGDVVRIPPSTRHSIEADSGTPLHYLAVDCFIAGRPQDEPTWDAHVHVVCKQQGWDCETVQNDSAAD